MDALHDSVSDRYPLKMFSAYLITPQLQALILCHLSPFSFNPLTPNDHYRGRTAPLTSKSCILYIYSTNTGTEYFKHGIYSPFFSFKMQFVS